MDMLIEIMQSKETLEWRKINRTSEICRTSLSAPSYVLWVFSDSCTFELYQTLEKKINTSFSQNCPKMEEEGTPKLILWYQDYYDNKIR